MVLFCVRKGIIVLGWLMVFMPAGFAQKAALSGKVMSEGKAVEFATVFLAKTSFGSATDSTGRYSVKNIPPGTYQVQVSCIGYLKAEKTIVVDGENTIVDFELNADGTTLNEVVITGVSRATLVRENPIAIIGISPRALEQAAESNIIDALSKNAPGLAVVKTGPNISKPFIRGLGYNRVLTLYDGIRQEGQQWGDEHGIEVDAYNMERAEVIKGPSSLMYGSDALAGVVSLFPYIPDEQDGKIHGKLTSEYQTNNNLIGNGLQVGYSDKHFLAALRGSYRVAKNYRNAVDGRVYNTNFDEKNISALLGYTNDKGYSHFNVTLYDNLQGIPDGSRDSLSRKFTRQIYEGLADHVTKRPVVSDDELNSYKLSPLHQHIQHYRMYTHNFYAIGKGDIDFQFAFQQNHRREYNHPTAPQQAGLYLRLNTCNYGLRYNAPAIANIETTAGINGMVQNNKSKNATDFPIPDYNLVDAGMYVHFKWKHKDWTLGGGARYDVRDVRWNDFYVGTDPATGFGRHVSIPDTAHAVLQFSKYQKRLGGISASAGVTYQVNPQVSLKANIARGYRAPNITEIASNGLDPGAHIIYLGNRNFDPEFSLQEDIGITAHYSNFSGSLSVFNNHVTNYIYLSLLVDADNNPIRDTQGNKTYQYKQSSAQLYGTEATFSLHPEKIKGFRWDNSLALVYGFNRKSEYKNDKQNGEYLPLIPPVKFVTDVSQKMTVRSKYITSLTARMETELTAAQNRYLGINNTETRTPGYAVLNVGVSADIPYCRSNTAQLQVQVNNLLNEVYQSNLSRLKYFEYYSQTPNGRSGIYNMGRNICMKLVLPL